MGLSLMHASTVPNILNLLTHRITAQYHCVFDDWFATVDMNPDEILDFESDMWMYLFGNARYLHDFDPDDRLAPTLHVNYQQHVTEHILAELPPAPPVPHDTGRNATTQKERHEHIPFVDPPETTNNFVDLLRPSKNEEIVAHDSAPMNEPNPPGKQQQLQDDKNINPLIIESEDLVKPEADADALAIPDPTTTNLRCSSYINKGKFTSQRFHEEEFSLLMSTAYPINRALEFLLEVHATAVNNPDTLSWSKAMRAPDVDLFKDSAHTELKALQQAGMSSIMDKARATSKILPGIWVFCHKRNQGTREICKYKGRYSVWGDLQEGKFDTFVPVVQWSTVCMLMMIALRYGYKTKCIDFSNAFVQAKLSTPVWIHLVCGNYQDIFGEDTVDKCLELKKSLYRLSVAPKLWYLHLQKQLEVKGFKLSAINPCLYFRNSVAIAVYVDDLIMIGHTTKELEVIVKDLQEDFKVTDKGELSGFLGIDVKHHGNKFQVAEPTLIRKIINSAGLTDCKPNKIPRTNVLGSLKNDLPHSKEWEYSSMIGMLMYLLCNSRPDIAFAIHQCTCFTHNPRCRHSQAVKQIVRYLVGTKDEGLIFEPTKELTVDCYVDADFGGAFNKHRETEDPATVPLQTSFVIYVNGIPISGVSKLQTEITLSTMEAEYVALSTATRDVLSLRNQLEEMMNELKIQKELKFKAHSQVFEDNAGALALTTLLTLTPHSKHYATKYHFFKLRTKEQGGMLDIKKINTKDQVADILTKPLDTTLFRPFANC
jgi:Reverse transcriptase (RNA-dependent DNA polymerase)